MNAMPSQFESLDEVQLWALDRLLAVGQRVSPRGTETKELMGVGFTLTRPRSRCLTNGARRFSLPLAIGEFAWHMSGSDEVASLAYYASRWKDFSADNRRITGSCYGSKIFNPRNRVSSQWNRVVSLLRADSASRRAVLSLWDDGALDPGSVDVPCTCTIQFLARDGRLHAVVFMRSNDAVWGLPYDVFLFTMLQEYLALQLGMELGEYTHFAGSLHLYDRHYELARRVLSTVATAFEMPPMAQVGIEDFLRLETAIRSEGCTAIPARLDAYWRDLASVLVWQRMAKDRGGYSSAADCVPASPYSSFLSMLVESRSQRSAAIS